MSHSVSTSLVVPRSRTSTLSITMPRAESTPSKYTNERIKSGLDYADQRLSSQRKPSPNTAKILTLYKGACDELLKIRETSSSSETLTRLTELRDYEMDMSNAAWISEIPKDNLPRDILELRQFSFLARYGDVAKQVANKMRKTAQSQQIASWERLSGSQNWTEISKNLEAELETWTSLKKSAEVKMKEASTCYALDQACAHNGLLFKPVVDTIHLYAERNQLFHRGLDWLIEHKDFNKLGEILFEDLRDLASLVPPNQLHLEVALRATIEALINEWFDKEEYPNEPKKWKATKVLDDLGNTGRPAKLSATAQKQQMAAKAMKLAEICQEEGELIMQAATYVKDSQILPVPGPLPKGKRKASGDVDVSDRKKAFKAIVQQQEEVTADYLKVTQRQREVNRIVSAYRAEHGDAPPETSPPIPPQAP